MKLTKRLLQAIEEALTFRLAGEIEDDLEAPQQRDYEDALEWVHDKRAERLK